MNSASMTFIPTAVRSSYRECEKTSVIPKPCVNFTPRCLRWQTALLGQGSSKSVDEKSIYAQKKIYSACKTRHACSMHDAAVSSGDFACKSTTDETFSVVNKSLSVYPSKGNDNCNISTMVQQTRLACNIACIHVFPSLHVVISWTHTCSCN